MSAGPSWESRPIGWKGRPEGEIPRKAREGAEIQGFDFSGMDLSGLEFEKVDFSGCNFSNCNLKDTQFSHCQLMNVDFSKADLTNAYLGGSHIWADVGGVLNMVTPGSNIYLSEERTYQNLDLTNTNLKIYGKDIDLSRRRFEDCQFVTAPNFRQIAGLNLQGCSLVRTRFASLLSECNLEGAILDDIEITDRWTGVDLEGAKWHRARLDKVVFVGCNFSQGDLGDVSFCGSIFEDCSFREVSQDHSLFLAASFKRCDFAAADLSTAHFSWASFTNCNFDGTRFRRTPLVGVKFEGEIPEGIEASKFSPTDYIFRTKLQQAPFVEEPLIEFCDDSWEPRPWTCITGPNGSGKTTILRLLQGGNHWEFGERKRQDALKLVIVPTRFDQIKRSTYLEPRREPRISSMKIRREVIDAASLIQWIDYYDVQHREWERYNLKEDSRAEKYERHARIFLKWQGLLEDSDLRWTFYEVDRSGKSENDVLFRSGDDAPVSIMHLSDGERTMIGLLTMIFSWWSDIRYSDRSMVVLIDEISTHFHVRWQKRIREFLLSSFPSTQFIVTTHSPFVVSSCEKNEVIMLEKEAEGVTIKQAPGAEGWRTEYIVKEVFGAGGPWDTETEAKILAYRNLLLKQLERKLTELESENLAELIADLRAVLHPDDPIMGLIQIESLQILTEEPDASSI